MGVKPTPEATRILELWRDWGLFGLRKLIDFGSSYALVIPKSWAETYCLEMINKAGKSELWIIAKQSEDYMNIILEPVTEDFLKFIAETQLEEKE